MDSVKNLIKVGTVGMVSILTVEAHKVPTIIGEWLLAHHPSEGQYYSDVSESLEYGDTEAMCKFVESWTLDGIGFMVIKNG